MCYLCYGDGHFLLNCPRLPAEVSSEAAANREAYLQQSSQAGASQMAYTRPATPHTFPRRCGSVQGHPPLPGVGTVPGVGPVFHVVKIRVPRRGGPQRGRGGKYSGGKLRGRKLGTRSPPTLENDKHCRPSAESRAIRSFAEPVTESVHLFPVP
jgi:hypothetical protein